MSRWFEVKVTTVRHYAVEVQDDQSADDAVEAVTQEVMEFDDIEVESERTIDSDIDSLKRHADEVLALGEDDE